MGNNTMGSSEVTAIGTTSVTHQMAIQRVTLSTSKAAGGISSGAPMSCSKANRKGPSRRKKFLRKGFKEVGFLLSLDPKITTLFPKIHDRKASLGIEYSNKVFKTLKTRENAVQCLPCIFRGLIEM